MVIILISGCLRLIVVIVVVVAFDFRCDLESHLYLSVTDSIPAFDAIVDSLLTQAHVKRAR
jgi:hypothetical protein